jgi:hypothetical protein
MTFDNKRQQQIRDTSRGLKFIPVNFFDKVSIIEVIDATRTSFSQEISIIFL